jgi:hypothetical protein
MTSPHLCAGDMFTIGHGGTIENWRDGSSHQNILMMDSLNIIFNNLPIIAETCSE